ALSGKIKAPGSLSFGNVKAGGSATKTFKVENIGLGILHVNVGTLSTPFIVTSVAGSFTLSERQSIPVTVQFDPTSSKPTRATLTITSDDPHHPTISLTVSGK